MQLFFVNQPGYSGTNVRLSIQDSNVTEGTEVSINKGYTDRYQREFFYIVMQNINFASTTLVKARLHLENSEQIWMTNSRLEKTHLTVKMEAENTVHVHIEDCQLEDKNSNNAILSLNNAILQVTRSHFWVRNSLSRQIFQWPEDQSIKLSLTDTCFNVSDTDGTTSIVNTFVGDLSVQNTTFLCKVNFEFVKHEDGHIFRCVSSCGRKEYRLTHSVPSVTHVKTASADSVVMETTRPACRQCPMGAVCDFPSVEPIPNYWGYNSSDDGRIQMLRCPQEYCCETKQDCTSIDACNSGRTGVLCGTCEGTKTESLFSPTCVPSEKCYSSLIIVLYVLAAVGYALFLLTFEKMKDFVVLRGQRVVTHVRQQVRTRMSRRKRGTIELEPVRGESARHNSRLVDSLLLPDSQSQVTFKAAQRPEHSEGRLCKSMEVLPSNRRKFQTSTEHEDTGRLSVAVLGLSSTSTSKAAEQKQTEEEGSMKYLQLVFFYVQDAFLFHVGLPGGKSEDESALNTFFQFSPEIFLFHKKISAMCLASDNSAVLKVALKSLFGLCILIVLVSIYLLCYLWSRFGKTNVSTFANFKGKLCEAFLLTVLLSYQQVVEGAFTLVKCVPVHELHVLYIQGNIQCFTWWQIVIEIYIVLCVPIFIVMAFGPSSVDKRHMSVYLFLVSCMFPVPVLLYLALIKIVRHYKSGNALQTAQTASEPNQQSRENTKVVVDTLLVQYQTYDLCGVSVTWLGVQKLYRLMLVASNTYIIEPLPRLCLMTVFVLVIAVTTMFVRPYNDTVANNISVLSYAAGLCIAIINVVKATLVAGQHRPTPLVDDVVTHLDRCETVLVTWLPLVALVLWLLVTVFKHSAHKIKSRSVRKNKQISTLGK